MLTEKEANELMSKLFDLRKKTKTSNDPTFKVELERHERECIEKFKYLITMRTNRYSQFNNFEDLQQEGFLALLKAMQTYNPKKGSFFAWAHKYIGTRVSRSANAHTVIRYPLKVAKLNPPHKEQIIPTMIEERFCPDVKLETHQVAQIVKNLVKNLSDEQKEIISLAFGLDGDKPLSVNKLCKKFNISRLSCSKIINNALSLMKERIEL